MRLEEKVSQALEQVGNDRYILSIAVGQRADELSAGAKPLLGGAEIKNMKYTDIAIKEIATGVLKIDSLISKK
jgi:DNA-directed RNA polymerase subunit omega